MKFEEWYGIKTNNDGHDDFWTKAGLESAWNAALDEAVKVAEKEDGISGETGSEYGQGFEMACINIAEAIKELKDD